MTDLPAPGMSVVVASTDPAVSAAQALTRAYPGRFTGQVAARAWLDERRAALAVRGDGAGRAASSGCAASGAHRHASQQRGAARTAMARLDAGLLTECDQCGATLDWERLDALVQVVRCRGCAPVIEQETRWCR